MIKTDERLHLPCERLHCMHNVAGACAHRSCPLTTPGYRMPEQVADEIEQLYKQQNKKKRNYGTEQVSGAGNDYLHGLE